MAVLALSTTTTLVIRRSLLRPQQQRNGNKRSTVTLSHLPAMAFKVLYPVLLMTIRFRLLVRAHLTTDRSVPGMLIVTPVPTTTAAGSGARLASQQHTARQTRRFPLLLVVAVTISLNL